MEDEAKIYPLVSPKESDTLLIHGTDPRFQLAFRQFAEEELGIDNPVSMVIPGGIHDLISPVQMKLGKRLWKYLEYLVKHNNLKRVVVMNHEESSWYQKWNALVRASIDNEVLQHLLIAAHKLFKKKLNIDVECYVAKIYGNNEGVVFEEIEIPG